MRTLAGTEMELEGSIGTTLAIFHSSDVPSDPYRADSLRSCAETILAVEKASCMCAERIPKMEPVFTVVQGMRYIRLGDIKILGVQYRDENGGSYWELAFWSIRNSEVRLCNVARGDCPAT